MKTNKILIFGDSFANVFKSFNDPNIKVFKYKGATAKGLTKVGNVNRKDIVNKLKITHNVSRCVVFVFGNVDLHFSYYHTLLLNKDFDIKEIIRNYVTFIASLKVNKNVSKYIFNIFPSPIEKKYVPNQLLLYGIGNEETIKNKQDIILAHSDNELRIKRLREANVFLEKECIANNIKFVDINRYIIKKGKIKKEFIDPSIFNVHLLYEPQLKFIVKKLTKCKITNNYDPEDERQYLQNKLVELKNKKMRKIMTIKKSKTKYLALKNMNIDNQIGDKKLKTNINNINNKDIMEIKYNEHLSEPWFSLISLGLKIVEGRKNKGKFKDMQVGDIIQWYNDDFKERKILTKIIGKAEYRTFEEYLTTEGLDKCLPGIPSLEHGLSVYYKYFTKEDETKFGVVAIRLKLL